MKLYIFLLLLATGTASAQTLKETAKRPLTLNDAQVQTHNEDNVERKQWSLTDEEWQRYKTLMQGIRGSISPATISPIEVLGTHARDERERQKYAEIWAKMRHEDAHRILEFQRAYNEAFQRLYGDEPLIDINKIKRKQSLSFTQDDRLLVFTKVHQCVECERVLQRIWQGAQTKQVQIDIFFTDTRKTDNDLIRQWAKQHSIDQRRLHVGTVTLNHDNGNLFRITKSMINDVPVVFRANAQSVEKIQL